MSITYKINILNELKAKGYSTFKLRNEKLLAESTIQQLRNNTLISWQNIDRICNLLNCQPGDILEHIKNE